MYPVEYEVDFNPTPNRATTFFRIILAIPWFLVAVFWGLLFSVAHLITWIAIIILGRYPKWLFSFNSGVVRFSLRLSGWFYLQSDQWPPFGLGEDPAYPIRVEIAPAAERQSRLKALFRLILALPVLIVYSYGTAYITYMAGGVAWLTIVFRGYLPEEINDMLTYLHGFQARVIGYLAFLTDEYPPIGLEKAKSSGADLQQNPPSPPPSPAPAV